MGQRNTPCNECRRHRRKCIRSSAINTCSRCERLGRDCFTSSSSEYSSESEQDVVSVNAQVDQLNMMIAKLEQEINALRLSQNGISSTSVTLGPNVHSHSSTNEAWKLTICNGQFQIETGIRSITDLLLSQPMQYLSPFSSVSNDQGDSELVMYFGSDQFISLIPLTMEVLERSMNDRVVPKTLMIPTSLLFDCRDTIDKLLEIYFNCHNAIKPLIHKPTFMKDYNQLRSPLDSLVCIGICAYVCAAACDHTANNLAELRNMGDYFYTLAKSKLMDQFDEEEKRLDNVIAISLLTDYMHITLKIGDCKRLTTIAYQICLDLKDWYYKPPIDKPDLINKALYSRHYENIMEVNQLMDYIGNRTMNVLTFQRLEWSHLPDEPPETVELVDSQNWLFKLYNNPFLDNIRLQIYRVHLGAVCSLSFESIVRLDEIIREWWCELPQKYSLCESWLDLDYCKKKIDETDDLVSLTMFTNFLIYMMDIYSCLLQPKALESTNNQLLSVVQELTLKRSLQCCRLLIHCVESISANKTIPACHYHLGINENLFHTIDVLVMLTTSSNITVRKEANTMLRLAMSEIDKMKFMADHRVDPKISPLHASMNGKLSSSIDLAFYDKYPRPWFAMIYDACHYLAKL